MRRTRQEIENELAHQQQMLRILRARRRSLEQQVAQQGNGTTPQVLNELAALIDQIHIRERELGQLEALAVEDRIPGAEVEYCVLLAEAWNTPHGQPSVASATRLEQARLQLGITPKRAQELEQRIRVALAQEALLAVRHLDDLGEPHGLRSVEQAVYLDPATVLRWLLVSNSPRLAQHCVQILQKHWLSPSRIWPRPEDRSLFVRFLTTLEDALEKRERAVVHPRR
jgi:hypothetical protein